MKLKTKSMTVALLLLLTTVTTNTLYAKEITAKDMVSEINTGMDIDAEVEYEIKTSGSRVNLRSGPGVNYSIITKIPNNSTVVKISDFTNGDWAKTVFVGEKGKEYIGYIKYDKKYTNIKAEYERILGDITGNKVVFRKSDSKFSSKLGYFYKGNTVEILEEAKNGYYKVKVVNTDGEYKDNIGYVHSNYIKFLK